MGKVDVSKLNKFFDDEIKKQNFCDSRTERELSSFNVKDSFRPFTI
jgi:hypothetical protein